MINKIGKNKGFTVIETLVVIVIIAILAAIVASNVSAQKTKAENAKKITDIRGYIEALQLYYFDHVSFPIDDNANNGCCLGNPKKSNCWYVSPCNTLNSQLAPYFPGLPTDISASNNGYVYFSTSYSGEECDNINVVCDNFSIMWKIRGANQPCKIGRQVNGTSSYTWCQYILREL